jgi:hypothetical protein
VDEIMFGVITALDMNTEVDWAAEQQQRAGGGLDRAHLFSAGTLATVPGGHGTEFGTVPTLTTHPPPARRRRNGRSGRGGAGAASAPQRSAHRRTVRAHCPRARA